MFVNLRFGIQILSQASHMCDVQLSRRMHVDALKLEIMALKWIRLCVLPRWVPNCLLLLRFRIS